MNPTLREQGSHSDRGGELATRAELVSNLYREIDALEDTILESGPRIFGHTVIDEDKICQLIDRVRDAIPSAIAKAEEILKYRQDILNEAEQYARQAVEIADLQAAKLVEESQIVRQAEFEANQLRRHTQDECEELKSRTLDEINQMRRQAQKEWEAFRERVIAETEDLQRGADEYSDRILGNLESQLVEMLKIVQNGRLELRQ